MTCKYCDITDEQKQKLLEELDGKMYHILSEFKEKIPEPALAAYLIGQAKEIMCSWDVNYYSTVGMLSEMLHHDLEEVYDKWSSLKESQEDEEGEE